MSRLLKPYSGTPPPALDGSSRPDLLTRIAGAAVPHFVSVVMALGGDGELPALPQVRNRRPVRIAERRIVARDDTVAQLTLVDPDGAGLPRWHAGAHIDIHLPSGRIRQYSLCGDPARQHEYRIAVRRIPRGGGGSIEMHELVVGDTVEISTPRNGFLMPAPGSGSKADRLRFVAGGIGITPILPMVRRADRLGVPWSLHYLGRHLASLPFLDEVLAFGSKVRVRTDDEHGLPTAAELLDGVDARSAVYVCGPTPLIELVRRGVPAEAELHIERFSPLPVVDGDPFELELARTGVIVQVAADQSALAALREARANIAYSCQQGFCGTCVQRVLDGRVEHRDHTLTDRQRDAGQMLVCVSRAATLGGRLTLDI
ncbi:PDR/VanB family oxidoreductase [Mycobacterium sp. ACS4331]|uniref:PDR/VanB family oxidoreductase n=1 Tax=Mycobacterium sp. ACS4331 TaxID=1834121 RepID=UPI0007FD1A67|nr:PDR/VanB family oxidoreductase [Mycobacterium sp. ACS4331]OBF25122.1 ferredoxin [Mycobacterium sp. ACS4331]